MPAIVPSLKRLLRPTPSPEAQQRKALQRRFDDSEVIFVCFPKCGSTWLEVILTQYLVHKHGVTGARIRDLHPVSKQIPSVAVTVRTHDDDPHLKPVERFERDKSKYADKRVLFLVRDPRDVLVSYYFEYTKKKEHEAAGEPPFRGTVNDFMHHKIGGLRAIITFFNQWAENKHVPRDFMMVRYEEMHRDIATEIVRVLSFLDKEAVDEDSLREAITIGRFENMRKLEEQSIPGLRLNPNVQLGDTEGYKVRQGKVAGYRNYLSPAAVAEAERIINAELSNFYSFYKD